MTSTFHHCCACPCLPRASCVYVCDKHELSRPPSYAHRSTTHRRQRPQSEVRVSETQRQGQIHEKNVSARALSRFAHCSVGAAGSCGELFSGPLRSKCSHPDIEVGRGRNQSTNSEAYMLQYQQVVADETHDYDVSWCICCAWLGVRRRPSRRSCRSSRSRRQRN